MVRVSRTTSPLWPWTPGTGRWRPLQTTVGRVSTSMSAGHWFRWEVGALTCILHCNELSIESISKPFLRNQPRAKLLYQVHGSVPPVRHPVWRLEMSMWIWAKWSPALRGTGASWSCSTAAASSVPIKDATGAASSASSVTQTKWWGHTQQTAHLIICSTCISMQPRQDCGEFQAWNFAYPSLNAPV